MLGPVLLAAAGLSKRFRNREALCGVDLIARSGSVHGLLGPNGAGKTTLMRVVLGLVRPDSGCVRVFDQDSDSQAGGIPKGVAGFVETPAFYPYLSGRKNLALLARLDGLSRPEASIAVERSLEDVGLTAQAEATVAGYSAGMRQRLGLAAGILRSPRLLLLDEPTSSLDPAGAHAVRTLARRLAATGTAVIWSSHDMTEVEELCDAMTVINAGRVVFSGTLAELRSLAPPVAHVRLHTSYDQAAAILASQQPAVTVSAAPDGGLDVSGGAEALDAYVIALGCAGIAIRALERRTRSLETLFLTLTASGSGRSDPGAIDLHGPREEAPAVSLQ